VRFIGVSAPDCGYSELGYWSYGVSGERKGHGQRGRLPSPWRMDRRRYSGMKQGHGREPNSRADIIDLFAGERLDRDLTGEAEPGRGRPEKCRGLVRADGECASRRWLYRRCGNSIVRKLGQGKLFIYLQWFSNSPTLEASSEALLAIER